MTTFVGNKIIKNTDKRDIILLKKAKDILIDKQKYPETRRALNESAVRYICCAITALEARDRQ